MERLLKELLEEFNERLEESVYQSITYKYKNVKDAEEIIEEAFEIWNKGRVYNETGKLIFVYFLDFLNREKAVLDYINLEVRIQKVPRPLTEYTLSLFKF